MVGVAWCAGVPAPAQVSRYGVASAQYGPLMILVGGSVLSSAVSQDWLESVDVTVYDSVSSTWYGGLKVNGGFSAISYHTMASHPNSARVRSHHPFNVIGPNSKSFVQAETLS